MHPRPAIHQGAIAFIQQHMSARLVRWRLLRFRVTILAFESTFLFARPFSGAQIWHGHRGFLSRLFKTAVPARCKPGSDSWSR